MATKYDKVKPNAFLDLAAGDPLDVVSERYSVPKTTVQGWAKQVASRIGKSTTEVRAERFEDYLEQAFVAMTEANKAVLQLPTDKDWLRNKTAQPGGIAEVLNLIVTLTKNTIAIGRATGSVQDEADYGSPAALEPGREEAIDAEVYEG